MNATFVTAVNDAEIYNGLELSLPAGSQCVSSAYHGSAAAALNHGIDKADNNIIVCCHQDVRFPPNWVDRLEQQIKIVGGGFGVLGTFGVDMAGCWAGNIDDPHHNPLFGPLPRMVQSLDEHCLIIRKDSGLRFDEELGGWHLYGADICLEARRQGLLCFAINAWLEHLSGGKIDQGFRDIAEKFKDKWTRMGNSPHDIRTTCGHFNLNEVSEV
jgi:hypothetical protein